MPAEHPPCDESQCRNHEINQRPAHGARQVDAAGQVGRFVGVEGGELVGDDQAGGHGVANGLAAENVADDV